MNDTIHVMPSSAKQRPTLKRIGTPRFFQTKGQGFILRMSPDEYAEQYPLQIRPAPTELVGLGLVLTEFDPKPAAATAGAVR